MRDGGLYAFIVIMFIIPFFVIVIGGVGGYLRQEWKNARNNK